MRLFICVVFAAVLAASLGDHVPVEEYWDQLGIDTPARLQNHDYDSYELFDSSPEDNSDLKSGEEINGEEENDFKSIEDYQIEDNRSDEEVAEDSKEGDEVRSIFNVESDDSNAVESENAENDKDVGEVPVEAEEPQADEELEKIDSDELDEDLAVNNNDKILEETLNILENDSDNDFGVQSVEETNVESEDLKTEINNLLDKILNESDSEEYDNHDDGKETSALSVNDEENNSGLESDENILEDLDVDLKQLSETYDKLKDEVDAKENNKDLDIASDVKDYEEKYGRPFGEASILALRNVDYENIDDSNLSKIFKQNAEDAASKEADLDKTVKETINSDENDLDDDVIVGWPIDVLDGQNDVNLDDTKESDEMDKLEQTSNELTDNDDNVKEKDSDDQESDTKELFNNISDEELNSLATALKDIFPEDYPYGDDGLVDSKIPKEIDAEQIEPVGDYEEDADDDVDIAKPNSKMVDDLSSAELDQIMAQFIIAHKEDLDVNSEDFDKNVAPVHITLTQDPVVITSPNYPEPYPSDNIVDWIFEGAGTGIELNITDFAVNGALGDYLLVKPGGRDDSGHEGLIFSYHLNNELRYRFMDVDRMFVRFKANQAWLSPRGFQFSVRMILPPMEPEEIPEAEPVLHRPRHTLTLNLAGLTLAQFRTTQAAFESLIADMASEYINENDIYYGYNSTLEVTQVTRTAVCSIHWPNYETCVEVTFGVPLNYGNEDLDPRLNDDDLADMWRSLIGREKFAERLEKIGIQEYLIPDDRSVLTVWLVISAGVIISMAMLAFALWRYSCFEDYTRMQAYSDTDSIRNEKRNLDLYPTPHQTLPPLYTENEYKWTDEKYDDTRVDMGGLANKSFVRDEMYNFDSDEDVISPRDRKGIVSSKDVYEV